MLYTIEFSFMGIRAWLRLFPSAWFSLGSSRAPASPLTAELAVGAGRKPSRSTSPHTIRASMRTELFHNRDLSPPSRLAIL